MKKHWLDSLDFFGTPIPGLNFETRQSIGTWVGLLATICLFTLQLNYSLLKLTHLAIGHNPQISVA